MSDMQRGRIVQDKTTGRQGRIVTAHVQSEGDLRAYAWVERQCPDGTVERETCWLDDLVPVDVPSEPNSNDGGDRT